MATAALADQPSAALRREVAQRVAELSSPLRAERQRAEQSLLELGPQVLELLPSPNDVADQATRVAVRQLRVRLERAAAEESVQPSRVSFRGTATVADIAAQISAQTGNRLDVSRLPPAVQRHSIEFAANDEPFWDIVGRLVDAAGLDLQPATGSPELQLVERPSDASPPRAPIVTAGAFRVSLDSLRRQRGTIRASFRVLAEPRLRPLFVRIEDAAFSTLSDGESLPLFSPKAVTELPMTSRDPAAFAVQFQDEGDPATVTVKGRVTAHVAAAPLEVRFDDLSGKRVMYQRRGGVGVTLKRSTWTAGTDGRSTLTARLSIAYDAGGPEFESHRAWIYHNDVRIESPDDTAFPPDAGFDVTRQADGGAEVEYRFSKVPDRTPRGWTLIYVAPTLLIDVPVEFTFEDAPVSNAE